ncbi:Glyoxalase-like domain protein [Phaeobacter piscinae]|uniref:Glyoxalase-like domain protein n=1 Tax=Phaeobacter piscinae TaxID=1580596 RepID=A0AAN1L9P8_9RHOB|nr:VOC family protein [Phaeobacter piscinae]ATG42706.1 Glyoxalase-like domain protein [Phaeobacter piscinae]AUR35024.1 Glyoxalase-like domain protein [Phaeobacter piscinae]
MTMRRVCTAPVALLLAAGIASADPFKEITVGVPVTSITDAEAWYLTLFGPEVEVLKPVPGVVEFKVAPDTWYQIFETENPQPSGAVVRFLVEDMAASQAKWADAGIDTGAAIQIPDVVTYSEFTDPDGNALGLYDLP